MGKLIAKINNGLFRFFSLQKNRLTTYSRFGVLTPSGCIGSEVVMDLETNLKIKIKNKDIFEQALMHRSYIHILRAQTGKYEEIQSNERLEFLGDSILNMITADYLFMRYPNLLEGELTKKRANLVNTHSLAFCAKELELDKFLLVSLSAEKSIKKGYDTILADALEAIIAAVFLDSGYDYVKRFIVHVVLPIIMNNQIANEANYKSMLLEIVQAYGKPFPTYKMIDEQGPAHDRDFEMAVYVDECLMGVGKGKNKKQAEQIAAKVALEKFKKEVVYSQS